MSAALLAVCCALALLVGPAAGAVLPELAAEVEVEVEVEATIALPAVAVIAMRRKPRLRRPERAIGGRPTSHSSSHQRRAPVAIGNAPEPSTGPPLRRGPPPTS